MATGARTITRAGESAGVAGLPTVGGAGHGFVRWFFECNLASVFPELSRSSSKERRFGRFAVSIYTFLIDSAVQATNLDW